MNAPSCRVSFPVQTLTAYWLDELDGPAESEFEDHLFGCAACAQRLEVLVGLGEGVKQVVRKGNVRAILPVPFVKRLQELGVCVREYRVPAGGSVMCTVAPQDDFVVAHLQAPLQGVQRLDLVVHNQADDTRARIEDVAFDPSIDEVVMLSNTVQLRQLSFATVHVQLVAVDPSRERVIGEYTFNHSPWPPDMRC